MKISMFLKPVEGNDPIKPVLSTGGSLAADVHCILPEVVIQPGETVFVDTGVVAKVPRGWALLVLPRSSMATKRHLSIPNAPGLVDRDYCGPNDVIKVGLRNLGTEPQTIKRGERIAQLLMVQCEQPEITFVEVHSDLSPNFIPTGKPANRGGFGSTGR